MSKGVLTRLVLVLALLGGCLWLSLEKEPRLGIDLSGGTQITLQAESTDTTEATPANVDKAIEVLRGRVDALGVAEPTLVRVGGNRILVELPDVRMAEQASEALGRTAQLSVHAVIKGSREDPSLTEKSKPSEKDGVILPSDQGDLLDLGPAMLRGDDITGAQPNLDPTSGSGWTVVVDFSGKGSKAFGDLSEAAACAQGDANRIAIVLDNEVISSPGVNVPCGQGIYGSTEISGNFTVEDAKQLAVLIEGGALPLPVEIIETREIGPTLGEAAIEASWKAGLVGLLLTGLFIALVYRLVGVLATVALASYALLAYAMLIGIGATLTLPGLAGFVLAIGLAIDANVLVFEWAKEEYTANPRGGLRNALIKGFRQAWTAIIDSNVTTLLAAGLLFFLGSGPIKGFGVTLSIGVVASMVSALIIAKVLTEVGVAIPFVKKHPKVSGIAHGSRVREWLEKSDIDLMGKRKLWLGLSGAALVLAAIGIGVQGLNLGVDFTGGRVLEYQTEKTVDVDEARAAVSDAGFTEATVQMSDQGNVSVRVGQITDEEKDDITAAVAEVGGTATLEIDDGISASLGKELRNKALIAFAVAFLVQMLYLAIRFKWTFGLAAVLAMFHDVFIVLGVFAWLNKPIDGIFLAAAMTIIGLSVNDTVVVFDRIRSTWFASHREHFNYIANKACLQTVPRTVNTGLGAMFILAALAVLGGDSLRDFAIALLLGLIVGTWSSVFTATPLVTYLQERSPLSRAPKIKKAPRSPNDYGAVV